MNCPKCGDFIPEGANFCTTCGMAVKDMVEKEEEKPEEKPIEDVEIMNTSSSEIKEEPPIPTEENEIVNKPKNHLPLKIFGGVLIGLIIVGLCFFIFQRITGGPSYKSCLLDYVDARYKIYYGPLESEKDATEKVKTLMQYVAPEEYILKAIKEDGYETIDEYYEAEGEYYFDSFEKFDTGETITYKHEISRSKELEHSEVVELLEFDAEEYNLDLSKVSEAYQAKVKTTLTIDDEDDIVENNQFIVYRYDNQWYITTAY